MTFLERYQLADTWKDKCLIMNLYHTARSMNTKGWTLKDTAHDFGVSIGLVSENIKLANAIDLNSSKITNCKTRQEALAKLSK